MATLIELFKNSKLKDIESDVNSQIQELPIGYYDAKLAVMLSMIIVNGMEKFETINCESFPEDLRQQFKLIQDSYRDKISIFKQHIDENARIVRVIEDAQTTYPELEHKIRCLLSQFDDLLKIKIEERDTLPVSKL